MSRYPIFYNIEARDPVAVDRVPDGATVIEVHSYDEVYLVGFQPAQRSENTLEARS